MKYKSVVVTRRGGPEGLQIAENDLRPPAAEEARIKVLATPDEVGPGVTGVAPGDRVVALTQFGGYAEYIYLPEAKLVHAPPALDPAEAVTLVLNYLVAYQVLHRVAQVKAGDKALIIGASGGVGTAFLQLGRLAKLKLYGLASASKHQALAAHGTIPIDYRTQDFVQVLRQAEPGGLDFVFNGMGEEYFERGLAVLRRGGTFVHYGGPQSLARFGLLVGKMMVHSLWPNGKKLKGYGTHRLGVDLFKEDWAQLFALLEAGQIKPLIAGRYPLLEARRANELLESGQVTGTIVLLAPELLTS